VNGAHVYAPVALQAMSRDAVERVRALEDYSLANVEQTKAVTRHLIHAGIYTRTVSIPKGDTLTGAMIKIPTTLIVSGKVSVYVGNDTPFLLEGYHVLAASAGRKTAFHAHEASELTMFFRTQARTVEEAEREFTDEHEKLFSRRGENVVQITGDKP
jgi:hypothetical protein